MIGLQEIGTLLEREVRDEECGKVTAAVQLAIGKDMKKETIFGLPLPEDECEAAAVARTRPVRFHRIEQYRMDEERVRKFCERAKIEPLAVVPTKSWTRICDDAGLFRLQPHDGWGYRFETQNIAWRVQEQRKASRILPKIPPILCGVVTVASALLAYRMPGQFWSDYAPEAALAWPLITLALVATIIGVSNSLEDRHKKAWLKSGCDHWIRTHTWAEILFELFGRGRMLSAQEYGAVRIDLPPPPLEVLAILKRLLRSIGEQENPRLDVMLACEPDAIRFNMAQVFADIPGDLLRWEEEQRRLRDPIVYVTLGTAVAVVAQYGDFPIERHVVERVIELGLAL